MILNISCKWNHIIWAFCVWLLLLNVMCARFIHTEARINASFLSVMEYSIVLIYHGIAMMNGLAIHQLTTVGLAIHQFIFFFPHFLAIMNNPAIFAQVFVCSYVSSSLGKIPRSGTAGLDGQFRFNYLKNCQTAFPKWLDHIPSPPAKSISPYLHPVFAIVFLDTTFPVCLNQYLIMILICIPLMTNGVDIFLCLLAICVSWDKCLFKFFFHF